MAYALVEVIAPDGDIADKVKVDFDREQPIDIEPLVHQKEGRFPSEYKLRLSQVYADGDVIVE